MGIPWLSRGQDSVLSLQEAQVLIPGWGTEILDAA